jgi:hypothetical protein
VAVVYSKMLTEYITMYLQLITWIRFLPPEIILTIWRLLTKKHVRCYQQKKDRERISVTENAANRVLTAAINCPQLPSTAINFELTKRFLCYFVFRNRKTLRRLSYPGSTCIQTHLWCMCIKIVNVS